MRRLESRQPRNMDRNDEELIKSYLAGDEQSLRALISRYLRPIYHFAYRYTANGPDAEDIAQEVFVKVWKNLRRYNGETPFRPWLFAIAKNAAIDWLRKKKTIPFSKFDGEEGDILAETLRDPAIPIDQAAAQKDYLSSVTKKLSPETQNLLQLRHSDQLKFQEIAKMLGKPLNTVKSRYRRALAELRKLIAEY